MIENDVADKIGKGVATIFIALLFVLFAYGYLWPLIH